MEVDYIQLGVFHVSGREESSKAKWLVNLLGVAGGIAIYQTIKSVFSSFLWGARHSLRLPTSLSVAFSL